MHIDKQREVDNLCGIAGYCDFTRNLLFQKEEHKKQVEKMGKTLTHRGPNAFGSYVNEHVAFSHTRLAVIDIEGGVQPMLRKVEGYEYAIVYNGELYNTQEIKDVLLKKGYQFSTTSDTEVLLMAYVAYGKEVVEHLNGIYSFAIWSEKEKECFLCRDRFGVKPFFYALRGGKLIFGSEIKALLAHSEVKPIVNTYGLCEIFGLGPARSPGCGVFENINEIPPGYCACYDYSGIKLYSYWKLEARKHTQTYEETVQEVRKLLFDAIERQLVSDVPICTLLSGGLDSSIISAVAARYLRHQGKILDTYSFDYTDNHQNFKASHFQPDEDKPFVDIMVQAIGSKHQYLECEYEELYECLYAAVIAKDLPGMADVDSSMLYFAKKIKQNHTVCLSGECADEIFGGYPWFREKESYETNAFPWSKNLNFRKEIMSETLLKKLPLDEYVRCQYQKTMERVPLLPEEKEASKDNLSRRQREISYLNTSWFMTTLLDRKDRMTMANGLEVRVPFADHRLIGYLYNVPWEYKYHNQEVKGLLKDVACDLLPKEVIWRKKCPYPKTYDPKYEALLKIELNRILKDKNAPITELIHHKNLENLMEAKSDYARPWFGQLMALPQMYAYLIEMNYWFEKYHIVLRE